VHYIYTEKVLSTSYERRRRRGAAEEAESEDGAEPEVKQALQSTLGSDFEDNSAGEEDAAMDQEGYDVARQEAEQSTEAEESAAENENEEAATENDNELDEVGARYENEAGAEERAAQNKNENEAEAEEVAAESKGDEENAEAPADRSPSPAADASDQEKPMKILRRPIQPRPAI
jgi:hypothetical protein